MTRRILEIVGTLDRGAHQQQILLLAAGLPCEAFSVHVAALAPGPLACEFQRQRIPLTVMSNSRRFDPGAWLRLRRHIARLKPDVVHTWAGASIYGRLAAVAAGARSIVATYCHAESSTTLPGWASETWLRGRTDIVVVDSSTIARPAAITTNEANRVRRIPPGVPRSQPSDRTREQLLAELNLPPGARLIGVVGPLAWRTRVKDLIWAADLLKVIRDDTHLLVIGDGPQRKGLVRYRRLCHIADKVHFLGFRHDVPRLLPHFDLLWQAGKSENLSMAVLEAMAAGVPVVAADTAAHRELVTPGQTGYLVPLGDRAGFGRAANTILNDTALARRLGAAAQHRIARDFNVQSMVEAHAALYRGVRG